MANYLPLAFFGSVRVRQNSVLLLLSCFFSLRPSVPSWFRAALRAKSDLSFFVISTALFLLRLLSLSLSLSLFLSLSVPEKEG